MAVSEKSDFILCEIKSQLFHDSTHRNGYITAFTSICDAYHLFGIKVKVTKSAWSSSNARTRVVGSWQGNTTLRYQNISVPRSVRILQNWSRSVCQSASFCAQWWALREFVGRTNYRRTAQDTAGQHRTPPYTAGHYRKQENQLLSI